MFEQAKTLETFVRWVEQLKQHRLYRQHLLTFGTRVAPVVRAQGCSDSPIESSKLRFVQGIKERNFSVGCDLNFIGRLNAKLLDLD